LIYWSRILAYSRLDLDKHLDDLMESIVATARYTHTPLSEVVSLPMAEFARVGRALDRIIKAENTPTKG